MQCETRNHVGCCAIGARKNRVSGGPHLRNYAHRLPEKFLAQGEFVRRREFVLRGAYFLPFRRNRAWHETQQRIDRRIRLGTWICVVAQQDQCWNLPGSVVYESCNQRVGLLLRITLQKL